MRTDPCACQGWSGFDPVCNTANTTVVGVALFSSHLNGTIPDEVGAWVDIINFDIGDNAITGPLPSSMSRWRQFTGQFDVKRNYISGGVMPALPFETMELCILFEKEETGPLDPDKNSFDCPWPAGVTANCDNVGPTPVTDSQCTQPPTKQLLRLSGCCCSVRWSCIRIGTCTVITQ